MGAWWGVYTGWRSAVCSPASRCFTGSGMPPRWPWSGWSSVPSKCDSVLLPVRDGDDRRVIDTQWATAHLASLGVQGISRQNYLDRLALALQAPDWVADPARR